MNNLTDIRKTLFSLADEQYKAFHQKLIPTVESSRVIGVRTPALRKYARTLKKNSEATAISFMNTLPHYYYEENNLHAFLVEQESGFDDCIKRLCKFLPYIDNWATCDMLKPPCFKQNRVSLFPIACDWLRSPHTYTCRYGINTLMTHFLDEQYAATSMELVCSIVTDDYYINMGIAWFFATALCRHYDSALVYLNEHRLTPFCHNKTIQKAVESLIITKQQKDYLKTLRLCR